MFASVIKLNLNAGVIHHDMKIKFDFSGNSVEVIDSFTIPDKTPGFSFYLHKGLNPVPAADGVSIEPLKDAEKTEKIFEYYYIEVKPGAKTAKIKYSGKIFHPFEEQAQEYARSFSETPGMVSEQGCYLSGSSGFYPRMAKELVTFRIEAELPKDYGIVTQGERISDAAQGNSRRTVWSEKNPQDDIALSCGKFKEYSEKKDPSFHVFLRNPDDSLAKKYLKTTKQYVEMYSKLLGPYPYKKFALVENFWETGYGIPSFTLLGPKVIRLPFILHSSYPHEILHNWWGNGAFVDYEKGNWCEGLTAYLADYLISEQRGKGRDYRMAVLQKYSDYVSISKDFPIIEFRSRHSSASEAVGYGKTMMFYHMLRQKFGDKKFIDALRHFYLKNKFRRAVFEDLKNSFEKTTDDNLDYFFDQWLAKTGAPELELKHPIIEKSDDKYLLKFEIGQKQDYLYDLDIPVVIHFENESHAFRTFINTNQKSESFEMEFSSKPLILELDPEFDVFRKLHPLETPSTLSKLLGAQKPLILLPSESPEMKFYEEFALNWSKDKENPPEIKKDNEISRLPRDKSIWLLGKENKFSAEALKNLEKYGIKFNKNQTLIDNQGFDNTHSFIFSDFNPANPEHGLGIIIPASADALKPLSTKLPHYGKYTCLVFDSRMNSIKTSRREITDSPLSFKFAQDSLKQTYPERNALGRLESEFSAKNIKKHIEFLAGSRLKGRGIGTPEIDKAADYIAKNFSSYGLKPFDSKNFFHIWTENFGNKTHKLKNVIAMLKGTDPKLSDEYIVIGAHYDHAGTGNGKIYFGADDNASGVSLLMELALYFSKNRAKRSLIFAAFTAEEHGEIGSKHFVNALTNEQISKINAMLNLDTIGRLQNKKILILNAASSKSWIHVFRGASLATGIETEIVQQDMDSSDQTSFIEKGVPAVQIFSGAHADYHKPTDTVDKIDINGIVKTGELIKEVIEYLAGGSDFIARTEGFSNRVEKTKTERKAGAGFIPDFTYTGKGVKIAELSENSTLSETGVKPGDVIVKIDGKEISGLKDYSEELKKRKPQDKVNLAIISGGEEKTITIELIEK
ncbi:MAG: M28 family peptidase [Elusimicrobia bacterium]|nr:M28 family peptidase [Elusimicrobiota bacterium]